MSENKKLTNSDLNTIWFRWNTHLSSMSYEKLQGHAYAFAYSPFANKYYKDDPEGKRRLLLRHSMFYNTEPQTGQLVNGIVASLEEKIAFEGNIDESLVVNTKAALMGPLAGIGDSLIQGVIVPLLLSIGMGLASGGNVLGPLFYIISYLAVGLFISYGSFRYGYSLGVRAVDTVVGEGAKRITDAFNVVGVTVVGALAAQTIVLNTPLEIPMGDDIEQLQNVIDGVFPNLLPLIIVLFAYWLISVKEMTATKVIVILTIIVSIGVILGIF